jgi:TFIIF-interacting CTD phosphatase-like protein
MKKTIIIDNTPENFEEQEENGIHIESWYSDSQDRELIKMISFLKSLVKNRVPDVRPMVKMFKS